MIVNTKLLNVRAGAGTKYEVVDQVASGTSVLVLEKKGNWYRVDLQNGIKGYVNQKFLSLPVQKIMNKKKEGESYGWKFWAILIGLFLFGLFRKRYSSSSTKYSMAENQENETYWKESKYKYNFSKDTENPIYDVFDDEKLNEIVEFIFKEAKSYLDTIINSKLI